MIDLEERLRDELLRTAQGFEPSVDLRERIGARIERRTQRNRLLLATAAVVVAVAAVAGGVVTLNREGDSNKVVTEPSPETTTTEPIDEDTPLSPWGLGPIRAGMTIAEAEAAAGVTLSVDPGSWEAFGRTCGSFRIEGIEAPYTAIVARTPDLVPSDDPGVAVIDAVGASSTEEGIDMSSSVDDVYATYGQPTRIEEDHLSTGGQILLYDRDGYTYGFRTWDGGVQGIMSGHVDSTDDFEPCG